MRISDLKEKLDFMEKHNIDSIVFRESRGIDYFEFELCYFRDPPEESLSLFYEGNRLVYAWDRDCFEELVEEFSFEW